MEKLSLNKRIALIIFIFILGNAIICVSSLSKMRTLHHTMDRLSTQVVVALNEAQNIRDLFHGQMIYERNLVIYFEEPERRDRNIELIAKNSKTVWEHLENYQKHAGPQATTVIEDFKTTYNNWISTNKKVLDSLNEDNAYKAKTIIATEGRDVRLAGDKILNAMIDSHTEEMKAGSQESDRLYDASLVMISVVSLISFVLGLGLAFYVMRKTNKAINHVIDELRGSSSQLATSSQEIASASEGLSQSSTEQASSLEETVATIEELTSIVKTNSESSKHAAELAGTTRDIAIRAEKEIRNLSSSMNQIASDSKKIVDIMTLVDDIAFQTNLLALNASVEAARAGEQGKGFAVVAEAVRGLAQRSAAASKDVAVLIKGSVERIEKGGTEAESSGRILEEILQSVQKVCDLNSEIATASEEQNRGISQIAQAMNQLDQTTQVNAATSEESAASSQELSSQAQALHRTVEHLVTAIHGANNDGPTEAITNHFKSEHMANAA